MLHQGRGKKKKAHARRERRGRGVLLPVWKEGASNSGAQKPKKTIEDVGGTSKPDHV